MSEQQVSKEELTSELKNICTFLETDGVIDSEGMKYNTQKYTFNIDAFYEIYYDTHYYAVKCRKFLDIEPITKWFVKCNDYRLIFLHLCGMGDYELLYMATDEEWHEDIAVNWDEIPRSFKL